MVNSDTQRRLQAARIRVGDRVRIGHWRTWYTVTAVEDPALLTLLTPAGSTIKAGRFSISEVRPAAEE